MLEQFLEPTEWKSSPWWHEVDDFEDRGNFHDHIGLRVALCLHVDEHLLQRLVGVLDCVAEIGKFFDQLTGIENGIAAWRFQDGFLVCKLEVLPLERGANMFLSER